MISKSISVVLGILSLLALALPTGVVVLQTAQAQSLGSDLANNVLDSVFDDGGGVEAEDDGEDDDVDTQGDDNQNIDQTADQTNEQEQEVDQENDQSETNIVANELDTGNNTAAVTQVNDGAQEVAAASESESEGAEAESEDGSGGNHGGKDRKKHDYSGSSSDSDSTSADAESIANAAAEATGIIDQNNTADVDQDSSANDNILVTENTFGDDENTQVAVPISDQDQTAENRAVNLDLNIIEEEAPPRTPDDGEDGEDGVFCLVERLFPGGEEQRTICFATSAECESVEALGVQLGIDVEECREFATPPAGALICRFDPQAGSVCETV